MITKLATVMGLKVETKLNTIEDPDCTYELTVDNLIKMLAIQLRFRYGICSIVDFLNYIMSKHTFFCRSNIPVILMGETGCGKTRLIKYMCQLARQGQELKNFFMLKVVHHTLSYIYFYSAQCVLFPFRYTVEQQMLIF